jgi:hypothetical protein
MAQAQTSDAPKPKAAALSAEAQRALDIRFVMDNVQGRRFVQAILEQARMDETTFNRDAGVMAFAEGCRHVGCWLKKECQRDARLSFAEMEQEAFEAAERADREDKKPREVSVD